MIYEMLGHGPGAGITMKELERMLGINQRDIRTIIQRERLAGLPILSDNENGYFLPSSEDDKVRFIKSMRNRAQEIARAADAVEKGVGN